MRAVGTNRLAAVSPHPDRTGVIPDDVLRALGGMGLLSPRAVDDGGEGVPDHLAWTMIAEELATADAGTALDVVLGAYAAVIVGRCGTDEQRRRLAALGDTERGTVLYFEGFGRSPLELETTASPAGAGWVLAGRKTAVVRARTSSFGIAFARSGTDLLAFLLPASSLAALVVERDDGASGKPGARSAATSTVELTPAAAAELLGGGAPLDRHRNVAGMRLAIASILVGVGAAAVRYAAHYASGREAFGRTIAAFQGVAFPLVETEMAIEAARVAIRDLAADVEHIDDAVALASRTGEAVAAAAHAASVATTTAVNTLGGHGYLTDHPVERWYRDVAVLAAIDFDPLLTEWSAGR